MADAIDDFIALSQDQQLATLQGLPRDKQDAVLAKVKQRRANTSPLPEGVTQAGTNASGGRILAPVTSSPWAEAGKAIMDPASWEQAGNAALDELKSVPQGIASLVVPQTTGGKVAQAVAGPVLPIAKMIQGELQSRGKLTSQAADQFKSGHPVLGTASTILSGLPIPGVPGMAAGINDAEAQGDTAGAAGKGLTDAAMLAAPFVVKGAAKIVPPILRRGTEIVTNTGPKQTEALVKETAAENAKSADKTAGENAAQDAKRKTQVQQHFEKTKAADEANTAAQDAKDRKVALERGVEHLDPELKSELEKTEETVHAEANRQYTVLRKALKDDRSSMYQPRDEEGNIQGEPISVPERLNNAADASLRGSDSSPTIIKDIAKRVQQGEVNLTYDDLQGYREEIGRELRKGTLPPDVFNAYKKMMPMIDDAMQEIADRKGLGKAQSDARSYYRQYAEAFIDRNSPIRKALDSTERGQTVKAFSGKDQSGVEQLAKFNPDLARRFNTVRGYASEAKGIRPSTAQPKTAPALPPKPAPVEPEVKTVGSEDVRGAKAQGLQERADYIRKWGPRVVSTMVGYRMLGQILHGEFSGIPQDLGAAAVGLGASEAFARLLENPKIVKALTEPTARDIEAIPPEMRGDLSDVVKAAQKKGVKVSPALVTAVIGTTRSPNHPLSQSPVQ